MKSRLYAVIGISILSMSGCASIDFGGDGLTYYVPKPYLFVAISDKCVSTATVVNIPGKKKVMKFKNGYGSSELSASFTNGMVASVGQKSDSKIPETITSIASLGTAAALFTKSIDKDETRCIPTATLYPIKNGVPDDNNPVNFSVKQGTRERGQNKRTGSIIEN